MWWKRGNEREREMSRERKRGRKKLGVWDLVKGRALSVFPFQHSVEKEERGREGRKEGEEEG